MRGIKPNHDVVRQFVDERDVEVNEQYIKAVMDILDDRSKIRVISKWLNAISVVNPTENELSRLESLPFVKSMEIVHSFSPLNEDFNIDSNDEEPSKRTIEEDDVLIYGQSYSQLHLANVIPFHNRGSFGQGVRILVLDSGFNTDRHIAFVNLSIIDTYDFVRNEPSVYGPKTGEKRHQTQHGTQVLSILSGRDPGSFYGVAFESEYLLAKTEDLSSETPIEEDYIVAALEWGEERGADVMTTSLGYSAWYNSADYTGQRSISTRAINTAIEKGMVCITSVGNGYQEEHTTISVPADAYYIISVGSVNSKGFISSFSSRGPTSDNRIKPEVCALGSGARFVRYDRSHGYSSGFGTSYAAPIVGGCVALILQEHPDWSPKRIRRALLNTAFRSELQEEPDNYYGWGIINADEASKFEDSECNEETEDDENVYLMSYYGFDTTCEKNGLWICDEGYGGKKCESKYICEEGVNCACYCMANRCVSEEDLSSFPPILDICLQFLMLLVNLIVNFF